METVYIIEENMLRVYNKSGILLASIHLGDSKESKKWDEFKSVPKRKPVDN